MNQCGSGQFVWCRTRAKFVEVRDRYLSAARPIQTEEHLKGREKVLSDLVDALRSPGRHAFIYGYRGVGKTSLAQTAAFRIQSAKRPPAIVSCETSSTFESVIRDVVIQAAGLNPLATSRQSGLSGGLTFAGMGANASMSGSSVPPNVQITGVADAVNLLNFVAQDKSELTIVIDEFDQIVDAEQHRKFANLIKQISDRGIAVRVILCGIAETAEALLSEHASIFRQVHATEVERLKPQARLDIIDDALKALGMTIPRGLCYRISSISDGFPSFVHLVTEKVLTATFDENLLETNGTTYERGLEDAVRSVELTLKRTYERAVHRNTKNLETVVWALASEKFLEANVEAIWNQYRRICTMLSVHAAPREKFAQRLGLLCKDDYGPLLVRLRHANYAFGEKMMRAYARLRAEFAGCQIGEENPDYSMGKVAAPEMGALISYHDPK